jgi:hypothetical protein
LRPFFSSRPPCPEEEEQQQGEEEEQEEQEEEEVEEERVVEKEGMARGVRMRKKQARWACFKRLRCKKKKSKRERERGCLKRRRCGGLELVVSISLCRALRWLFRPSGG